MSDDWTGAADWWRTEVAGDDVFATDVMPLVDELVTVGQGPWLDLGCGEGRVMRRLGGDVVGCDVSGALLRTAAAWGPVVECRLPQLGWIRTAALAGAYAVLVLEHIADLDELLAQTHRVVRPGGWLVSVANHPAFTAAGSGPVVDVDDGELSWRWGPYLEAAETPTEVGGRVVTFHHRPVGVVLTAAARTGWVLDTMVERGLGAEAVAANPGYGGQEQLPRLVGWRWRRA